MIQFLKIQLCSRVDLRVQSVTHLLIHQIFTVHLQNQAQSRMRRCYMHMHVLGKIRR